MNQEKQPITIEESAPAKTKEEWLAFADRLLKCSIGSESRIEREAFMDFTQELIKDAMPFLSPSDRQRSMRISQDIYLTEKEIAEHQDSLTVDKLYFVKLIRDLVKYVQSKDVEAMHQQEDSQFLEEKDDLIYRIANLLNSNLEDSLIVSQGINLLKDSFWFVREDNARSFWEDIINKLLKLKSNLESNTAKDSSINYESEIKELSEKIKDLLTEVVKMLS